MSRFPPASSATNGLDGRGDQLLGGSRLDDAAFDEDGDPVGERRGVDEVVRDEDRRQAELAQELAQLGPDAAARVRVERGHRLVEQQDLRVARERARERDALALAAGELAGLRLRQAARSRAARAGRRGRRPPNDDVLLDASGAGRARTPGRRSPPSAPRAGRSSSLRAVEPDVAVERRPAAAGRTSPAIARSTRRLARAGGADERDRLRADVERYLDVEAAKRNGEIEPSRAHEKTLSADEDRRADEHEQRADRERDVEVLVELARRSRAAASGSLPAGCRRR